MSWHDFFSKIYLINLAKRTDRLLISAEQCDKYDIPYQRIEAIDDPEQGARGLMETMKRIFNEAIANNYPHILVLEDDFKIVVDKFTFTDTMEKIVAQLPGHYHVCFLGGQATGRFTHFHSSNLIQVIKYFSTHSVIYSLQGIREIMAVGFGFPIDNWMVDNIQPLGRCYTCHPLLCTQFAGYSDIGHAEIDWNMFIEPRHEQRINEFRLGM